jgi:hypothetical protein
MISRECIESALKHDGEPFEDEELEEMMSVAAVETATGSMVIPYELYINKILVSHISIYTLISFSVLTYAVQ